MGKCTAITRGGGRCKGVAIDGSGLCYSHHPDHEQDRRRSARKGSGAGEDALRASWQGSGPASRSWPTRSSPAKWSARTVLSRASC